MELKLNGNRRVSGVLRGFDPFMNMVIEVLCDFVQITLPNGLRSQLT